MVLAPLMTLATTMPFALAPIAPTALAAASRQLPVLPRAESAWPAQRLVQVRLANRNIRCAWEDLLPTVANVAFQPCHLLLLHPLQPPSLLLHPPSHLPNQSISAAAAREKRMKTRTKVILHTVPYPRTVPQATFSFAVNVNMVPFTLVRIRCVSTDSAIWI